jgi:hypothetical protein
MTEFTFMIQIEQFLAFLFGFPVWRLVAHDKDVG